MDGLFGAVLRVIIFLPLVAVLAYFSIKYGLGKTQHLRSSSHLQVIDRVVLSPKASLCVVKVVDRYYLMAVNEQHTALIKELDEYPLTENYLVQELKAVPIFTQLNEVWTAKFTQRGKKS